jgi:hypothetical protein
MTIWRMRIAFWIPKGTNTHTVCVILIALPRSSSGGHEIPHLLWNQNFRHCFHKNPSFCPLHILYIEPDQSTPRSPNRLP